MSETNTVPPASPQVIASSSMPTASTPKAGAVPENKDGEKKAEAKDLEVKTIFKTDTLAVMNASDLYYQICQSLSSLGARLPINVDKVSVALGSNAASLKKNLQRVNATTDHIFFEPSTDKDIHEGVLLHRQGGKKHDVLLPDGYKHDLNRTVQPADQDPDPNFKVTPKWKGAMKRAVGYKLSGTLQKPEKPALKKRKLMEGAGVNIKKKSAPKRRPKGRNGQINNAGDVEEGEEEEELDEVDEVIVKKNYMRAIW